jgi:hypothetical protein
MLPLTVVTDLTAAEIARLKFYEASDYEGSPYALTAISVECRGELLPAQVFFPTAHITPDETVWDFDTWAAAERPLFMAMVEERMSRYGSITAAETTRSGLKFRRRWNDASVAGTWIRILRRSGSCCELTLVRHLLVMNSLVAHAHGVARHRSGSMHKIYRLLTIAVFAFCVNSGQLFAQTLSLPDNLVDRNSKQGSQILLHSEALHSYWPLSIHFETQKNCGPETDIIGSTQFPQTRRL